MPSEALSDGICIPKQNEHTPHPALPLRIRHKLRPLQNSFPSERNFAKVSSYAGCCRPLHLRQILPPTAEALMRSRYSAYVLL
ncbi:hypothetical protein EZZ75_01470 [Neisseria meningitidis]|nr:hypothetical protein [Neisseria meningitidis]MBW8006202.1 hypothetical protein [Neisseria meningitidis]